MKPKAFEHAYRALLTESSQDVQEPNPPQHQTVHTSTIHQALQSHSHSHHFIQKHFLLIAISQMNLEVLSPSTTAQNSGEILIFMCNKQLRQLCSNPQNVQYSATSAIFVLYLSCMSNMLSVPCFCSVLYHDVFFCTCTYFNEIVSFI